MRRPVRCHSGPIRALVGAAALVVGLVAASPLAAQQTGRVTTRELLGRPHIEPDHVIPYGDGPRQIGHLRLPEGPGPYPVLIVIHGGCWLSFADLRHLDEFDERLTDAGWATWSIDYRPVDEPGGGWPGTFEDVANGIDRVRKLATEYSLDLSRMAVVGHSAGGHLALWAAGRGRIPQGAELYRPDPVLPSAAISLGGVGDLEAFHASGIPTCGPDIIPRLMGGAPEEVPERYAQGSPARLLPLGVPQLLVTGMEDGAVPPRFARGYADLAAAAGDRVSLRIPDAAGHFEPVAPWSPRWPGLRDAMLAFLKDHVP